MSSDTQLLERELEAALNSPLVEVRRVRAACSSLVAGLDGGLPPAHRAQAWLVLLGCHDKDASMVEEQMQLLETSTDTSGAAHQSEWRKTLNQDCARTRTDSSEFGEARRAKLQRLLAFYCQSRGVSYKQGLNEIVAPLLTLNRSMGETYKMFYSLISRFMPSLFDDDDFSSLRLVFKMFKLLLQYHEPRIANLLDQWGLEPEMYATPWLVTLFARGLPLPLLLPLWDRYLAFDDPLLHYSLAISLMWKHSNILLATDSSDLPAALGKLQSATITSIVDIHEHMDRAVVYRSFTPISFRQEVIEILFQMRRGNSSDVEQYITKIISRPCILTAAEELVDQCYSEILKDGSIKYIVLDCRSQEEYSAGHLPCAFHLDPSMLTNPETLLKQFENFESLRGLNLCLLGDELPTQQFLFQFLQRRFPLVSICQGGFIECHQRVMSSRSELVDHDLKRCVVCNPIKFTTVKRVASLGRSIVSQLSTASSTLVGRLSVAASNPSNSKTRDRSVTISSLKPNESILERQVLDIRAWRHMPDVHVFECGVLEYKRSTLGIRTVEDDSVLSADVYPPMKRARVVPCSMIVSEHYVMLLQVGAQDGIATDDPEAEWATIRSKHQIASLLRITVKKDDETCVSFQWKRGDAKSFDSVTVFIEDAVRGQCVDLVKRRYADYAKWKRQIIEQSSTEISLVDEKNVR